MPKVMDLAKSTISTEFEWEGETVHFTFRANGITPRQNRLIGTFYQIWRKSKPEDGSDEQPEVIDDDEAQELMESLVEMLAGLITDWDIMLDARKKYPITVESLMDLPSGFIFALFGAVMVANRPNPRSVENSSSS